MAFCLKLVHVEINKICGEFELHVLSGNLPENSSSSARVSDSIFSMTPLVCNNQLYRRKLVRLLSNFSSDILNLVFKF